MNVEREPVTSAENPIPANPLKTQPERKKFKLPVAGAVNIGLSALILSGLWLYAKADHDGPTTDQSKAQREFESLPADLKVHDLIVGTEGVKVRNKPHTEGSAIEESGDVLGTLEPGTKIESAIKVLGNDDDAPWVKDMKDIWFAFPNPSNPDEIVFANGDYINIPAEGNLVPVVDIDD